MKIILKANSQNNINYDIESMKVTFSSTSMNESIVFEISNGTFVSKGTGVDYEIDAHLIPCTYIKGDDETEIEEHDGWGSKILENLSGIFTKATMIQVGVYPIKDNSAKYSLILSDVIDEGHGTIWVKESDYKEESPIEFPFTTQLLEFE